MCWQDSSRGRKFLSVRQATLGIAAELTGEDVGSAPLAPLTSMVIIVVVIAGGVILTAVRLRRFQLRAAD